MKGNMMGGGGKIAKAEKKADKGLSLKQREKGLAAAKGLDKLDVLQKGLKDSAKKQVLKNSAKAAVKQVVKKMK